MICVACHAPLQPIHGALACVTSGCPLFGAPMAACCDGVSSDGLDAGPDTEPAAGADEPEEAPEDAARDAPRPPIKRR